MLYLIWFFLQALVGNWEVKGEFEERILRYVGDGDARASMDEEREVRGDFAEVYERLTHLTRGFFLFSFFFFFKSYMCYQLILKWYKQFQCIKN